ncbi:50S ribosomal protein L24 [Candidatus Woesearchaeota archaeon]|nr:50S ribosomal protein L24 [Candidatus Woesearchaeota archaeon]
MFSKSWNSSSQPRKQRKYRANAPLHIKGKFLAAHLSKELRKAYNRRGMRLRAGDKVKIMVGQFRKQEGNVEKVDTKKERAYVAGIEIVKRDGSKTLYPIHPSNLMITGLNLEDKKRKKILERKNLKEVKNEKTPKKTGGAKVVAN